MQPIELRPGMRVRCIDASNSWELDKGRDYRVIEANMRHWITIDGVRRVGIGTYRRTRFKPVIRVKAVCIPSPSLLVKRALDKFDAKKDAHYKAQRGEMELGRLGL